MPCLFEATVYGDTLRRPRPNLVAVNYSPCATLYIRNDPIYIRLYVAHECDRQMDRIAIALHSDARYKQIKYTKKHNKFT